MFVAQRAPGFLSREAPSAVLLAVVLGGLFDSRMNRALRHERGATYGVSASFGALRERGLLLVHAAFDSREAPESIERLLEELRRMKERPLHPSEIHAAKVHAFAERADSLSTRDGAARVVADAFALGEPGYPARFATELAAVSDGDVHAVAARYLTPDDTDIVVFGDARYLAEPLGILGNVRLFQIKEPAPLDPDEAANAATEARGAPLHPQTVRR